MAATAPAPARPAGCSRTAGLRGAVAAEWTKLVSLRSTWYLLLGAAVLTGVIAPPRVSSPTIRGPHPPDLPSSPNSTAPDWWWRHWRCSR
ncbi:hypothetical protein ACWV95_11565 [Streptomyces albus]